MKYEIYEMLENVGKASTHAEKVDLLKQYDCLGLRDVLRGAFDDSIVFTLPKGAPEYKSSLSKEGMSPTSLTRQTKQFGYFCRGGGGEHLMPVKREKMFLQILEGVHPKDAEVLIAMKDKEFNDRYKGLTKALVQEVWPKMIRQ